MKKRKVLLTALLLISVTVGALGFTACQGDMPFEPTHRHIWSAWTVTEENKPGDTEPGKATRTCSGFGECDATEEDKEYPLPVLSRDDYTMSADSATCSAAGKITYAYNKNGVNVSFDVATPVNASAHDYGNYTYTDGTGHYQVCSHNSAHTTKAEKHDTKGEDGACSVCGYKETATPPAVHNHYWGDGDGWTVTEDNIPTGTKPGKATRTCFGAGKCDATEEDTEYTLPVLSSAVYTKSADSANCSFAGIMTYTLDINGVPFSFDVVTPINPDAHEYGEYVNTDIDGHYKMCAHDAEHRTTVEPHELDESGICTECGFDSTKRGDMLTPTSRSVIITVGGDSPRCVVYGFPTAPAYYTYVYDGEKPITVSYRYYVLGDKEETRGTVTLSRDGRRTFTAYLETKATCTMEIVSDEATAFDTTLRLLKFGGVNPDRIETFELDKQTDVKTTYDGMMYEFTAETEYWYRLTNTGNNARVFVLNEDDTKQAVTLPYMFHLDAQEKITFLMCSVDEEGTYNAKIAKITTDTCQHNYSEEVVAPTCTEEGYTLHTCDICGDTYKDASTPAHHEYVWTVKEATCTEAGSKTGVCSKCNDTVEESIAKLPHNTEGVEWQTVKEATCTEEGEKTLSCKVCGNVVKTQVIPVNADAHDYGEWVKTDSTGHYKVCKLDEEHTTEVEAHDTNGLHGSCTVCGYMPKHTHTWSVWTVTDVPTETKEGKATRTCTSDIGICEATTANKERTLPVLTSADYTKTNDTATCTATGKITYTYNKNGINVSFDVTTPINNNHDYGEYTYTDGTGHYKVCSRDASHKTEVEAHDEDGEHHSCTVCGYMPTHEHVWSAWTVTTANKPAQTKEGKATRTCTSDIGVCEAAATDKEYTLPALTSSDYTKTADTATCTKTGKITYTYNKDGVNVSFDVATPINDNHDYDDYTYTDGTGHYQVCKRDEAHTTEVEAHNTNGSHGSCTVCGYMPKHTHTWSVWTVTDVPSETKEGKATRTCTSDIGICEATTANTERTLPVLTSADYTKTADTATCTATGKITYTYNKNGVNVSFDVATPTNDNHDYGDYTYTDGTGHYTVCSRDASHNTEVEAHNTDGEHGSCTVCGYMSAHTHAWSTWTVTDVPTETKEGKATRTCTSDIGICNATTANTERTLPVLTSADYTKTADTATCTATGKITYTYNKNNVNVSFDVETPINENHDYGDYTYADGTGHYKVCSRDASHKTEVESHDEDGEHHSCTVCGYMPKHEHVWSAWTVTTANKPTQTKEGKATRTCTSDIGVCEAAATDKEYTLPVLTSSDYTKTADTATCTATGKITYTYNKNNVNVSFDVATPINNNHDYGEWVKTDSTGHYKVCKLDEEHTTEVEAHDTNGLHGSCTVCGYMPKHTHAWSTWTVTDVPTETKEGKATRTCTSDIGICNATTANKERTLPVLTSADYTKTADTATCTATGKITYTYNKNGVSVSFDVATPTNDNHDYGDYTYTDGTGHYKVCSRDASHNTEVEAHDEDGEHHSCTVCGYMPKHEHVWSAWTVTTANKPAQTKEGKATRTCTSDIGVCEAAATDKEYTLPVLTSADYSKTADTATCTKTGKITYTYNKDGVSVSFDVATSINDNHDYDDYTYTDGTGHYQVCKRDEAHTTEVEAHDMAGTNGKCSVCGYVWPNMITTAVKEATVNVGGDKSATVYGYAPSAAYYTYTYKGETPITVSYSYGTATTETVTLSRDGRRSFTVQLGAKGVCTMTVSSDAAEAFDATIKLTYNGATDPNRTETFTLDAQADVKTTYDGVKYEFTAETEYWYIMTCRSANARVLVLKDNGTKEAVELPYIFHLGAGEKITFLMCSVDEDATYNAKVAKVTPDTCQHNYSEEVVAPTCTQQGYTLHTCDRCGNSYKDTYVNEIPHDYKYTVITAPTCTNVGKQKGVCTDCGDTIEEELAKKPHSTQTAEWQTVKEATCTEEGQEKLCCTVCHNVVNTRVTEVNPGAHSYAVTVTLKPTLTAAGTAQLVCQHNEEHTGTRVTLPALTSSEYTTFEDEQFMNYTIQTDIGEVSFPIELEEIKTIAKAIEYAIATSGMVVTSNINFALNDTYGQTNENIYYEIGNNYVHAIDGYMKTERWITLKADGTFFALIGKEDRDDKQQIMNDPSASLNDFKGYAFRFTYAQQEWEMPQEYGAAQFIDVLYKFASQNSNSVGFTQSIEELGGKTYYKFSYKFVDADPHNNTDMNHSISVEFTLNGDYFIDYCKLTGQSRRGKTIDSGELLATQIFTVTQHSRRGVGEAVPVNPYNEDTIALTDYKLQRVTVDEALNVTGRGSYLTGNSITGLTIGSSMILQVVDYAPTEGVNFFYDEVKVYLRAQGDTGMGELLQADYLGGEEGHILAGYDPISKLVSLGFWAAGDYELVFRTVKTEKVYSFHIAVQEPTRIDAYVYSYDDLSGKSEWKKVDTENGECSVYSGQDLKFYGSVEHPGYQYPDYTVEIKKSGTVVNGLLTTTEMDGKTVYVFTTDVVGTYTVKFTTAHANRTCTFDIKVLEAPSSDYLDGLFANDYKGVSVDFDMTNSRYTLKVGSATAVYGYTLNGRTITSTFVSGTNTGHEMYLNDAYELIYSQNGEKALLFKAGLPNAIIGHWLIPTELLKVNVTGNYSFSFSVSSYYGSDNSYVIGYSVDDGDSAGITGPLSIDLKSGQTIQFFTMSSGKYVDISMFVSVSGVTLDETEKTLNIGEHLSLVATVAPSDATNKNVTWSTDNASVATVANGVVTAVGAGTATITVTTLDGNKTATCFITVRDGAVTGVTLDKTSHQMYMNDTFTLTATVAPDYAVDKTVSWTSSNTSVATVDGNGVVTAKAEGTATITVTTTNGGFTANCTITVTRRAVTGVTLNKASHQMYMNDTLTLTATVAPLDATYKTVTWTSSNTSVATVDENGVVTPVGVGDAVITATTTDGGFTATCTVTVLGVELTNVSISPATISLYVHETSDITVTLTPANASYLSKSWTTSDSAVATVDNNGKVTAAGAGTATITLTVVTATATFTKTCAVTVSTVAVTGVTLDKTSHSMNVNETLTLTATVAPVNATNKNVTWSTDNASVATVANGVVTAVGAGTATITVTTADGGFTATCTVTAKVPVTGVTLNENGKEIYKGNSFTLTATVAPSDATNSNVTWTSSNTSVATVANGVVTAVGVGTATITVTTEEGGFTATCAVTVKVAHTGEHTLSYASKDADKHTVSCTVAGCDYEATEEDHVYDGDSDASCNLCNFMRVNHSDKHRLQYESIDENKHLVTCSVEGCNFVAYEEAHDFVNKQCSKCYYDQVVAGGTLSVGGQLTVASIGSDTVTVQLSGCEAGKEYKVTALKDGTKCSDVLFTVPALGIWGYWGNYGEVTFTYEDGVSVDLVTYSGTLKNITVTLVEVGGGNQGGGVQHDELTHILDYTSKNADKHTVSCLTAGCDHVAFDEDHVYSSNSDTTCNKCGYTREVADDEFTLAVGAQLTITSLDWSGISVQLSGCVAGKEYILTALKNGSKCNDVSISIPALGYYAGSYFGDITFTYASGATVMLSVPSGTVTNITVTLQEVVHEVVEHTGAHQLSYTPNGADKHTVSCTVAGCNYEVHEEDHVYGADGETCSLCGYKKGNGGNQGGGRTFEVNAPGFWAINTVEVGELKAGEEVTIVIKCSGSGTYRLYWKNGNTEDSRVDISADGVETGNVIFVTSNGTDVSFVVKSNSGDLTDVVISVEDW